MLPYVWQLNILQHCSLTSLLKRTDQSEKFVVADPSAGQCNVEIPTNNKLSGSEEGN